MSEKEENKEESSNGSKVIISVIILLLLVGLGVGGYFLYKYFKKPKTDECKPSCNNKECGSNGCGGVCGVCRSDENCTENGLCEKIQQRCVSNCPDLYCGDDGCGNNCSCPSGYVCNNSVCEKPCTCHNKKCGASNNCNPESKCGCPPNWVCGSSGNCECKDCVDKMCNGAICEWVESKGLAMGLQGQTINGPGNYGQWPVNNIETAKKLCLSIPDCKTVSYDIDNGTAMIFNDVPKNTNGLWIDSTKNGTVLRLK